ncbi:MAG: hypothetical protein KJZ65_11440 [Phycisphaerales bacterium]|nr:hypothetical protein [Phycisphaerales bacterium]
MLQTDCLGRSRTVLWVGVLTFLSVAWASAQVVNFDPIEAGGNRGGGDSDSQVEIRLLDSGWVENTLPGSGYRQIWTGIQRQPGAMWMRLHFDFGALSGEYGDVEATRLVLIGLDDGAVQILDGLDLIQWSMSSAYFNGDAVQVRVYASPGMGPSRVSVGSIEYGEPGFLDRSICGSVDDRVPAIDPASGRLLPANCTVWLVNDLAYGMLTAGHCEPTPGSVVQFNVPLSTIGGSMRHPPPQDQYVVDPSSVQTQSGSISTGNDWAFFGVFENPNTLLSPLAAQGSSYRASPTLPAADGRTVRVGGYGSVVLPMPLTYNFTYTTHSGNYVGSTGNTVRYTADTTGGNSGSAVIDESTGLAIAIHTSGGCNSSGANKGTATKNSGLRTALANPRGMAAQSDGSRISFPNQRPAEVLPTGETTIRARFGPSATRSPAIETARLHVWDQGAWTSVPMTRTSALDAEATFPALRSCDAMVRYYVSVQNDLGGIDVSPPGAPAITYQARVPIGGPTLFSSDMTSSDGWSSAETDGLSSGAWNGASIYTVGRMAPEVDFDGTGRCAVTGPHNGADVDSGLSTLISPSLNIGGASDPVLSFAAWYADTRPTPGAMLVEYWTDTDPTWRTLDQIGPTVGWDMRVYRLASLIGSAGTVRVRFTAGDHPNTAIVEAGVDRFRLEDMSCPRCAGDLNSDGTIDGADLEHLVRRLGSEDVDADLNADGNVDAADLMLLLAAMGGVCM